MKGDETLSEETIEVVNNMENRELKIKMETSGVLETAILSANLKFFKGTTEVHHNIVGEESVFYNTVIRYFTDKS